MHVRNWIQQVTNRLDHLEDIGAAGKRLQEILNGRSAHGIHLAIFVEPYLSFIFEGKKTIESRFNAAKHPPFGQVHPGDVIVLKKSSGPVCGICLVSHVWFYRLDPTSWREIDTFARALCMDNSPFWEEKRRVASFATLMRIESVERTPEINIDKVDPRGWVVIRPSGEHGQQVLI